MKMSWLLYSIIGMISFTFLILAARKASDLGVNTRLINLYIFGLVFLGFAVWSIGAGESIKISNNALLFLIVAAIFSLIGNFFMFGAVGKAPNPGYVAAIVGLHGVLVTILSLLIFKAEFAWIKLVGVALAAIAVVLISL